LEESLLQNLALLLHEWAVYRDDLDDARALQIALDSYLHPSLANYDQFYIDIKMQKCLYYSRTHNWKKAKETANLLVEYCKNHGYLSNQVRVLIHMSIMQLESDRKQCTAAMSPLLEALAMCEQLEMHGLHAAGMSILAVFFLRFQNPKRSIAILEATIPTLMQREHVWFQAEAFLTLAKCHLKIAGTTTAMASKGGNQTSEIPAAKRKRYGQALQALNKSLELFEACQDCSRLREGLYIQAHLYSLLGDLDKREASSERFVKIGSHNKKNGVNDVTILDSLNDPIKLQSLVERSIY